MCGLTKPQGRLLISTFAEQNLAEIHHLTGVGLDYPSLSQWQEWLRADFEVKALFQQKIPLYFSSPCGIATS